MKAREININGKTYLACFSTRVMLALEKRGGSVEHELNKILESQKLEDMFWLLHQMLCAGRRYALNEGLEPPPEISYDYLIDSVGIEDYQGLFGKIGQVITGDSTPTVETAPAKNTEATPGQ